jgi:hypothetical protein
MEKGGQKIRVMGALMVLVLALSSLYPYWFTAYPSALKMEAVGSSEMSVLVYTKLFMEFISLKLTAYARMNTRLNPARDLNYKLYEINNLKIFKILSTGDSSKWGLMMLITNVLCLLS